MRRSSKILFPLFTLLFATAAYTNNGIGYNCCPCECGSQSHTTFAARQLFQPASPEYITGFRDRLSAAECGKGGAFQIAVFGGKSTEGRKLATYFTPFCKSHLLARDSNVDCCEDLISRNFNVIQEAPFESTLSFCPCMSVFGVGLAYKQTLKNLKEDECEKKDLWIEISAPITRVETNMCMKECILTDEAEALEVPGFNQQFFNSMSNAFRQCAWCYGKIACNCKMVRWRLADIVVKLGYELAKCDCCFFEGYVSALIPTGNYRTAQYVFEPMVGHARHWGIGIGSNFRFDVWKNCAQDNIIEFAFDTYSHYLFKRREVRSFDLKYKPWSRYMEVYKNKAQATEANLAEEQAVKKHLSSPGINHFTKCLCVYPGIAATFNTAAIYSGENFRAEIGYNFFARQAECVRLECCTWQEGPALKDAEGGGNTNGLRTINKNYSSQLDECTGIDAALDLDNYDKNIIRACDIDLDSAAHPAFFSNTVYLSAGAHWDEKCTPAFFDVGGSYEFGCENAVLNRWTLWLKGGLSF